jgi:anti-anti-sigma factor
MDRTRMRPSAGDRLVHGTRTSPAGPAAGEGKDNVSHWGTLEWRTAVDADTGIRIYRLNGVLSDATQSGAFAAHLRGWLCSDPHPVLLDLRGLEHLTSTGIGVLATLCSSAQDARMPLAVCGLSARTRLLLKVVHLLDLVAAFETETQALAAYGRGGWDVRAAL